ncbi:MAG: alpha/beta hydrolase, partial [Verrucomicrobiae bacterium]|nr:alpha/beta hydrolase [Verrucomicrobiae bacterium]
AFLEAHLKGPGIMVGVRTKELHVVVEGKGPPGVLFISGMGDDHRTWARLANRLSDSARVVSYDRPGLGWSQPTPEEPGLVQAVADARALLMNSDLFPRPPVVVGHSLGGLIARQLAFEYPELVSGLVLLDPTPPEMPGAMSVVGTLVYRVTAALGAVGFTRWRFYHTHPDLTREQQLMWGHLNASAARARQTSRELRGAIGSAWAPHSANGLGDLPLTVMTAPAGAPPGMARAAAEVDAAKRLTAEESRRGRLVNVKTGHYIHYGDPDAVVAEIVRMFDMVAPNGETKDTVRPAR